MFKQWQSVTVDDVSLVSNINTSICRNTLNRYTFRRKSAFFSVYASIYSTSYYKPSRIPNGRHLKTEELISKNCRALNK